MNVKYIREELAKLLPLYSIIRAVIAGPTAIREGKTKFLPMPNPEDNSAENVARYDSYLVRARFYAVTSRTLAGYIGQVFYRDPILELPPLLKPLELRVDGGEMTLVQQAKEAIAENLSIGRGGLLTDYPTINLPEGQRGITLADQQSGKVRPTILLYKSEQIINWRWSVVGASRFLSMLVLEEKYDAEDDGFEVKKSTQWRVFRIEGGILRAYVYREGKDGYELNQDFYPRKGNGKNWDRIPFSPFGSMNNDIMPDKPPLEDMSHLNVGHYRNSADYEEACFICGQPTPWASGLDEDWVKDVMKGTMTLGSRGIIPLPQGGACGLLQAEPNTMPKEAMELKEKQMVALGAKLAENIQVQRTATETSADNVVENSVLATAAKNVTAAYMSALQFASDYSNNSSTFLFELNTDYEISKMSPQERQQLLAEWQGGGITWEEYRSSMKKSGVAFEDDKLAKAKIEEEMKNSFDLGLKQNMNPPEPENENDSANEDS